MSKHLSDWMNECKIMQPSKEGCFHVGKIRYIYFKNNKRFSMSALTFWILCTQIGRLSYFAWSAVTEDPHTFTGNIHQQWGDSWNLCIIISQMVSHLTCTIHSLLACAMMSLSSQKKAESDLLIISNLLSSFMAYTFLELFSRTYRYMINKTKEILGNL